MKNLVIHPSLLCFGSSVHGLLRGVLFVLPLDDADTLDGRDEFVWFKMKVVLYDNDEGNCNILENYSTLFLICCLAPET